MRFTNFFQFLAVALLTACSGCPRADHPPRLTEVEVVRMANDAARKDGYELSEWYPPEVHFEFVSHDCIWSVFYQIRSNVMPGGLLVTVNDITRRIELSGRESGRAGPLKTG